MVVLVLLNVIVAQNAEVQQLVQENPELLITLNNHFGCAEWDGDVCLTCAEHFYFNEKGICCQVKP